METSDEGKGLANHLFSHILQKVVTRVTLSYKACATIDFGQDVWIEVTTNKGIEKFVRGEWSLWLYACAWRIDHRGEPLVGSGDSVEKIHKHLPFLEGKRLIKMDILNNAFDLLLFLEEGLQLSVFSCETENPEPWTLSTPDRMVFGVGGANKWRYESGQAL